MILSVHGIVESSRSVSGGGFVPAADALVGAGVSIIRAYSIQRLLTSWAGDCGTLTSDAAGNPSSNISFLSSGSMDVAAADALASTPGGTGAFWTAWNDQTGTLNATNSVAGAPRFSSDIFAGGALGSNTAKAGSLLLTGSLNFSTMPFVWMVVRQGSALSTPVWTSSLATGRFLNFGATMSANFGATVSQTSGAAINTMYSLGFRSSSGSNVQLQINNTTIRSAASSTTGLAWSGTRIGASYNGAVSWWANAGALILEAVGFGSDPRALPEWADFVANRHAFYGI